MTLDLKIAQPAEFYRKFLREDARPDGRGLGEFRTTSLKLNPMSETTDGSAMVRIGETTVVCGVKAELFEPQPDDDPGMGRLVPNVELNAGCSALYRPGPPSEFAQVLGQILHDVLATSGLVDRRRLVVVQGRLAFVLFVDVVVLDLDGNALDASLAAIVAALSVTTLPEVKYDADAKTFMADRVNRHKLELTPDRLSASTTFSVFDDGVMLVDANAEEEELASEGQMSVVTLTDRVILIHKPGGAAVPQDKLQTCVDRAFKRTRFFRDLLEEAMKNPVLKP